MSLSRVPAPFRVYVGLVPTGYLNPEAIDRTVRAGLAFCGAATALGRLRPGNRLLVVPDIAMAEPRIARHAYTNPELLRGTLSEVLALDRGGYATVLGRTLGGFPGARVLSRADGGVERFRERGYHELDDLFPGRVEVLTWDDCELIRFQLSKDKVLSEQDARLLLSGGVLDAQPDLLRARLSNELEAPRDFYEANYVIYCPKLKSSAASQGFSGAVRLGAGAVRARLADVHACDMLEVCSPHAVVSDGIIAAVGGNQFTERGHELGVVLVANNALAHDIVAAQIFNLDPQKIIHLRMAMERGWGPSSLSTVELGGDGLEALRQLAQKTRFWDLGCIAVDDFKAKFERENPGLSFPVEIVSGLPYEASGAHGSVLEWLYLSYDSPKRRIGMARWPRASICVGHVSRYPAHRLVFAIGDRAIAALKGMTSSPGRRLRFGRRLEIVSAQLKNGRRHLIVSCQGSPPSLRQLVTAFALGSLGRMLPDVLTRPLIVDRLVNGLRKIIESPRAQARARLVIASRMRHNDWWALKPIRLAAHEDADSFN